MAGVSVTASPPPLCPPFFVVPSPGRLVESRVYEHIFEGVRMRNVDRPSPTQSPRPTAPTRPKEEIARLGDEIYERDVRGQVETDHHGEIVSIDVDSGSWAIGDNILEAVDRLRVQCPEAIDVWSLRVGYRAVHKFGGGSLGIVR